VQQLNLDCTHDHFVSHEILGSASAASSTPLMPLSPVVELPSAAISRKKRIIMASLIIIVVACGSFSKMPFMPTAAVVILYLIPICACLVVAFWFKYDTTRLPKDIG
jgi:hypothetical protein